MTRTKILILLIVIASLHWSCRTTKEVSETSSYCSSIQLDKGGCMNKCMSYIIRIGESGRAKYLGRVNVTRKGNFTRMLNKKEKTAVWDYLQNNDLFNFDGPTGGAGEDSQMRLLTIEKDGVQKKISYGEAAPKVLKDLESKIDAIAESGEWEGL